MKAYELIAEALELLDNGHSLASASGERRYSLCERMRAFLATRGKGDEPLTPLDRLIDAVECCDAKELMDAFLAIVQARAVESDEIAAKCKAEAEVRTEDAEAFAQRAREFRAVANGVIERMQAI